MEKRRSPPWRGWEHGWSFRPRAGPPASLGETGNRLLPSRAIHSERLPAQHLRRTVLRATGDAVRIRCGDYRRQRTKAEALPGANPGCRIRLSTAVTEALLITTSRDHTVSGLRVHDVVTVKSVHDVLTVVSYELEIAVCDFRFPGHAVANCDRIIQTQYPLHALRLHRARCDHGRDGSQFQQGRREDQRPGVSGQKTKEP